VFIFLFYFFFYDFNELKKLSLFLSSLDGAIITDPFCKAFSNSF